jgi:hypothetical protein
VSLGSWKDEFYSIEAYDTLEADALAHSLLKWSGMTDGKLDAHDVTADFRAGELCDDDEILLIADETCALCFHFQYDGRSDRCVACPLFKALGGVPCDYTDKPYTIWRQSGDAKPMIAALEAAAKLEAKK